MTVLLSLSLAFNWMCLVGIVRVVAKRGGVAYLRARLSRLWTNPSQLHSYQFPAYVSPIYARRSSLLEQLPIQAEDTVFLGDSITDEGEWSEFWADFSIKNRGIAGDTTLGLLRRLDPILDAQPQQLVLMIGINDLLNEHSQPAAISAHHQEILARIHNRTPTTRVLVQSLLPVNATLCGRRVDQEIMAMNRQLQTLAQEFGQVYVDLFTPFCDRQQQLDPQYTLDGVHLNGLGYRLWQDILDPYLRESLPNTNQD